MQVFERKVDGYKGICASKLSFLLFIDQPHVDGSSRNAVVLARNIDGYSEICRLVTDRNLNDDEFDLAMAYKVVFVRKY